MRFDLSDLLGKTGMILILTWLPFVAAAQFTLTTYEHYEELFLDEYETVPSYSYMFSVSSVKNPEAAALINQTLFKKLYGVDFTRMKAYDSLFPVFDQYSEKQAFGYEVIENSDRFFTVYFNYKRPYKETSHRYYTFIAQTGELKEMFDIIDEEAFFILADTAFKVYAADLDAYINNIPVWDEYAMMGMDDLLECQKHYFEKPERFEYGFIYLTTDSLHCVNPFCPDLSGWVVRREWFHCVFDQEYMAGLIDQRYLDYMRTGVWEYTLEEMLARADIHSGTINGDAGELRMVMKDEVWQGVLFNYAEERYYPIRLYVKGSKVQIQANDQLNEVSKLKLKKGRLVGTYKVSPEEELVIDIDVIFK